MPVAIVIAVLAYAITSDAETTEDYWRIPAEDFLRAVGVGGIAIGLWLALIGYVLFRRPLTLIRRWRLVLGGGLLVFALQGILHYFESSLPLVDTVSLGGDLGADVQGGNSVLAVVRLGVLFIAGVWVITPALMHATLRKAGRGGGKTASGSARAYRAAPIHKAAGRLLGVAWRRGARAAHTAQDYRKAKQEESLARKVGDFFNSSAEVEADDRLKLEEALELSDLAEEAVDEAPENDETPEDEETPSPELPETEDVEPDETEEEPVVAVKRRPSRGSWKLPKLALLAAPVVGGGISEYHHETAQLIEETLGQHGVEVRVAEIRPGPSVTMFGLVPGWNRKARPASRASDDGDGAGEVVPEAKNRVKVDAIIAREKDLALALAAPSLRLEAPVPGESVVGVEVPNKVATMVTLRSVMESDEYAAMLGTDTLPVALGLATAGEPAAIDLLKMPHLLIAGATGSGKSVCINAILSSIIMHQPPSKVRLLLIDPKRVELTPYNGI
ncbi:MAG: DNA translocase FtsK, partial [Dehalococcoidia bacterium]